MRKIESRVNDFRKAQEKREKANEFLRKVNEDLEKRVEGIIDLLKLQSKRLSTAELIGIISSLPAEVQREKADDIVNLLNCKNPEEFFEVVSKLPEIQKASNFIDLLKKQLGKCNFEEFTKVVAVLSERTGESVLERLVKYLNSGSVIVAVEDQRRVRHMIFTMKVYDALKSARTIPERVKMIPRIKELVMEAMESNGEMYNYDHFDLRVVIAIVSMFSYGWGEYKTVKAASAREVQKNASLLYIPLFYVMQDSCGRYTDGRVVTRKTGSCFKCCNWVFMTKYSRQLAKVGIKVKKTDGISASVSEA